MAASITQEDIINKKFQSTKFREGYDQEEVDDFLDEVAQGLVQVNQEGEELRDKLSAANQEVRELQQELAEREDQIHRLEVENHALAERPTEESSPEEETSAATQHEYATTPELRREDIVRSEIAPILTMAQQVSLQTIAQAETVREERLSRALAEAQELVARGQQEYDAAMSHLASDKAVEEEEITRLRQLNQEYRANLSSALRSMLDNVESSPAS